MDDLLNKPASRPESQPRAETTTDVRDQLESVRQYMISALVLMLIVAGVFDLYLLRQYKNENQELLAVHQEVDRFMADWQKVQQPAIDNFLQELAKYGQTHQDIGPILMKYNLKQATPGPATPMNSPLPGMAPNSALPSSKK